MVSKLLRDPRALLGIGIVLAILLFFWQAALAQGAFFLGDTSHGYFPRLMYTANSLREGRLPLWNPLVSLGGPHLADPAALALYPPAVLLFLALPGFVAYDYMILLHLALAAIFMYLYMRRITVGMYGAIFAALLFPFSGWMLTHYEHINVFIGALYVPLLFWIVEVAFQPHSWRWFVVSTLVIGIYFLGAHAQLPLFASIGLVLYALGRAVMVYREGWSWKQIGWTLVQLGGLGALGVGLAAIQLVPVAQAVALSSRSGGVGADVALGYSLPPEQIFTLAVPYLFGSPTGVAYWGRGAFREMTIYFGILPLLLAGVGVWQWRANRSARLLLLVAIVAWLLAMGRFTPLYGLLASLPLFNAVRYPPRFLFLVSFALIALAGIGLERVLLVRLSSRSIKIVLGVCAVFTTLLLILNLVFIQPSFFDGILTTVLDVYGRAQHPVNFYRERLVFALSWGQISGLALVTFVVSAFLWVAAAAWRQTSSKTTRVLAAGAIVLGILDLWVMNLSLPYNRLTDSRLYTEPSANATILSQDTSEYRLYYFDRNDTAGVNLVQKRVQQGDYTTYLERLREGLRGSFNTLYNIASITGFATEDGRHYQVMRALGGLPAYDLVGDDQYSDTLDLKLLSLLNGKYVTSLEDLSDTGLYLVNDGALVNLYRNDNVLPRAFVPSAVQVITEPQQVLETLVSDEFDPRATVLVEQDPQLTQTTGVRGSVEITQQAAEQVQLRANMATPGVVVLSDAYYPGWRVEVDGAPAPILRADYLLRGVALPAGLHTIRFYYAPDGFVFGAMISGVSISALLVIAGLGWWQDKKRYRPARLLNLNP